MGMAQPDDARSPQLSPAAASIHQPDFSDYLPKEFPPRGATGNARRKRSPLAAPIRLASTVSAAPGSVALEEAQCPALITAPVQEQRELRNIGLEKKRVRRTPTPTCPQHAREHDRWVWNRASPPTSRVTIRRPPLDPRRCTSSQATESRDGTSTSLFPMLPFPYPQVSILHYPPLKVLEVNKPLSAISNDSSDPILAGKNVGLDTCL
jgi:hypothetical protein